MKDLSQLSWCGYVDYQYAISCTSTISCVQNDIQIAMEWKSCSAQTRWWIFLWYAGLFQLGKPKVAHHKLFFPSKQTQIFLVVIDKVQIQPWTLPAWLQCTEELESLAQLLVRLHRWQPHQICEISSAVEMCQRRRGWSKLCWHSQSLPALSSQSLPLMDWSYSAKQGQ